MTNRSRSLGKLAAALLVVGVAALVPIPAQTAASQPDRWQFEITPYLWGAGLDGDVKLGNLATTGVEASFSDLFSHLELGLMAAFEGRRGRWGFVADGLYFKLTDSVPAPDPQFGTVDAELVQELYSAAGTYRAVEGRTTVDVLVGGRYVAIEPGLTLSGGVAPGRTASGEQSWWDGFVGGRVLYHPTDHWSILGYGDLGAGGSNLSWQVFVGGGYRFEKVVSLKFGYRYLSFDYESGSFVYDMAMAGPYLGVGFRF